MLILIQALAQMCDDTFFFPPKKLRLNELPGYVRGDIQRALSDKRLLHLPSCSSPPPRILSMLDTKNFTENGVLDSVRRDGGGERRGGGRGGQVQGGQNGDEHGCHDPVIASRLDKLEALLHICLQRLNEKTETQQLASIEEHLSSLKVSSLRNQKEILRLLAADSLSRGSQADSSMTASYFQMKYASQDMAEAMPVPVSAGGRVRVESARQEGEARSRVERQSDVSQDESLRSFSSTFSHRAHERDGGGGREGAVGGGGVFGQGASGQAFGGQGGGGDEELMRMRREVMMLKLERERGRMREESNGNSSHCSEYST
jgi:hypothetical protein